MPSGLVSKHRSTTIRRPNSVKSELNELPEKTLLRSKAPTLDVSRPSLYPDIAD
jgi:hypothetical protein